MTNFSNWIGIDDHADKWTIAQYRGARAEPEREWELEPGESGYRKLIGWLKEMRGPVRIVYEAGPCGYELQRRLQRSGLDCGVAAPSLTPRKPGDRIKTNRRDAQKLARMLRAGELTLITVPSERQESIRDLVRAREAANKDLLGARHQLSKLLLRHGYRYRDGKPWTQRFWGWVGQIKLGQEYSREVMRQQVRGIDWLTAMTILVELGDLRRFATAPQLMAAVGLVPSEFSTGDKTKRGSITKTGNAHVRRVLIESAWHYQRPTNRPGPRIRRRRAGQPTARLDIAQRCERRLHRRFTRLTSRGKRSTIAAVAVARELAGFIWAIGQIAY